MRSNIAELWLEERIRKYGPIFKLTLFGTPTVFIHGPAANKFIFTSDGNTLANQQTQSVQRILGAQNLLELSGDDHKRVRAALVSFLKPEVLKQYVGKMDEQVRVLREHLKMHWHDRQKVTVLPLMKNLTFNIISSLLFGLEHGARRKRLMECFQQMIEGAWSVPVNLPFTRYNCSLRASMRVQSIVKELIYEKRAALQKGHASRHKDLITCLLSIRGEDNEEVLSEKEIIDNVRLVMIAGHDTSSILITFLMRLPANDPLVYAKVFHEQEQIAQNKALGELLTWDDLTKMKYTWKVALETLRITPPVFGGFRKTRKDVDYGGYLIPKGWQVFWATNSTHMDECIFPEPSKFNPMHFDNQASIPPYCFIAFGGGPRICPGYEFAKIETLVTMHYLITRFTWKLCCTNNAFIRDPMPVPTQGLPILIEPKKTV